VSAPFTLAQAAAWTRGEILRGSPDTEFVGVSTDTRDVAAGMLFIAIRGPNHDAHEYAGQAAARGAAGLLVERGRELPADVPAGLPLLAVPDTTAALGALGAGHRAEFRGPVIAITGSNGKTTTKEMCAAILSTRAPCLKNRGNWNNEYGLPLTLLERSEQHRAAVVEIGMNHRGEIARLTALARPTIAVITNVGTAHIEHLGSRDEIAREKGDILGGLDDKGVAILNADDPRVLAQAERAPGRVVTFGRDADADVRAERVTSLGERGFAFDIVAPEGCQPVHLSGLGDVTVTNALAAAAAALAAGCTLADVAEGLAAYQPIGGRMERLTLPRNVIVINDTYNANPQSMEVALRSLADLRGSSRGVAVLGDMGELGEGSAEAHRATGRLVAELGVDFLFTLGEFAGLTADAAVAAGMARERVHAASDAEDLVAALRPLLQGNDWVLVKGSRSMRMERVIEALAHAGADG
jgi:UDP-N-acetylmuramoyl-tripeptide--D-alanyl-D-alanine ligase